MGSDAEDHPSRARREPGSEVPPPSDRADPRAWCGVAAARLRRDRPEEALEAARQAVDRDPHGEWGHRLASLALERLGRDSEAVASAQEAVRLAPGSWAARLRLAGALRRVPARWREAWEEAGRAVRYAPDEPGPHALSGDLALIRGDHDTAAASYRAALRRDPAQPGARVNLGLTFLRWDRHRDHHDPAWEADPRDTGRARRALDTWSRRIRLLLAVALTAVSVAGLGFDLYQEARIAGYAVLAAVPVITWRQAARITVWPLVPAMLGRDLWLSVSVTVAVMTVAAYVIGVAGMPALEITLTGSFLAPAAGGEWAGALGFVLFNAPAILVLRLLVEAWRGRPVRALAEFARVPGDATACRDTDVTLWVIAARAWWTILALAALPWPRVALAALAVPLWFALAGRWPRPDRSAGPVLGPVLRRDRWLGAAFVLLLVAAGCVAAAGAVPGWTRAWQAGWAALGLVAAAFAVRAATAWWRGAPGPTRASLVPRDHPPADLGPSSGLTDDVRHAATFSRSVVLSYAGPGGPRSVAVSAVTSVSPSGEMRVIAGDEAWEAVERDPRVAVFVGDPRFWAEVRGVAIADHDVLRITPREVLVREYPGRHQARTR
ncbi:hypothetical protein Hesp01_25790 [Herbidospora sp. NBRC 101105]|nr:hypothetical protein Hesp01_25790 [Herbidospora sp. NBRC 101105]